MVFVSSAIAGLEAERLAVHAAVQAIPVARPWLFELTTASLQPLAESCLSKVPAGDIFLLLLKDRRSGAVNTEVEAEGSMRKPRLVFVADGVPDELVRYAQVQGVKYALYRQFKHVTSYCCYPVN